MLFKNVRLEGLDYELPEEIWSSDRIEQFLGSLYNRLKLPFGRLELMTGIKERRFWPKGMRPSEAAAKAGKKLLAKCGIDADKIDLLIHAAVSRDKLEPATASYVHRELGLAGHTQIFDVSNACLGFLNGIVLAGSMIDSGLIKRALIVAGENARPLLENTLSHLLNGKLDRNGIKPFFANLTIGSGSVAALLCHESLASPNAPRLVAGISETDTASNHLCEGHSSSGDELQMQTDSEKLLDAGIKVAKRGWTKFRELTGLAADKFDRIICHQVGRRHLFELYKALGLDLTKDFSTFEKLGNIGSVSVPITLAMAAEQGKIKKGDDVALLGIGSGLSSLMLSIKW